MKKEKENKVIVEMEKIIIRIKKRIEDKKWRGLVK
jgi:hypothetical protein